VFKGPAKMLEIIIACQNGHVDVAAELGGTVEDASLPPH
jgi:hypothetical protein